ncbi:MAG: DUF4197 domain-containing protein [Bacteroidia bacterium]
MRTIKSVIGLLFLFPILSCSQVDFNKIGKEINNTVNSGTPLSNQEIIDGLKEALSYGSKNASGSASKVDGFFKNNIIKIPFPPEAAAVESKLRSLGMNKQVDDFVLTINRAAEEAAKQAAPIFVDAVKGMTITDGLNILNGADTAATGFLRQRTNSQLQAKFTPVVHSAVQKVDVTKYWSPLINTYNKLPFVTKMNPDLDAYITQRALHGLFYLVSQEEIKIRKDPQARVTALLQKVFGSKH